MLTCCRVTIRKENERNNSERIQANIAPTHNSNSHSSSRNQIKPNENVNNDWDGYVSNFNNIASLNQSK